MTPPGALPTTPRDARGASAYLPSALVGVLFAAVYVAVASAAVQLAVVATNVTPFWPAAGLAVGFAVLRGRSIWPWIFVGATVANALNHIPLSSAALIGVGNTLEAILAAWCLERAAGGERFPDRIPGILRFIAFSAGAAPVLAATVGSLTIRALGLVAPDVAFGDVWVTWWLGDALGIVLVAPLIVTWARPDADAREHHGGRLEAAMLAAVLLAGAYSLFRGVSHGEAYRNPLVYLAFPCMAWAAFRFGQRGASLAAATLAGFMVAGLLYGTWPVRGVSLNQAVLISQTFCGAIAVTGLVLGGEFTRRIRVERGLEMSEARYRVLVEHAPEAIVVFDVDAGRFVDVNANAETLFGLPRARLLELGPIELSVPVQPDGRPSGEAARGYLARALAGTPLTFEWTHCTGDGTPVMCEVTLIRLPDPTRNLARGSIVDISDRKAAQFLQEGQRRIFEALTHGASEPTIMRIIVELLEARVHGARGAVLLSDQDGARLTLGAAPRLPTDYGQLVTSVRVAPDAGTSGAAAYLNKTVITGDVSADPHWTPSQRELSTALGMRACWAAPFRNARGGVLGVVTAYFEQPRTPTDAERQVLDTVAHLAGIVGQRLESGRALELAEEQLHHAQRLESLGRLAGGVAHDFNNLLTVITSASHLLRDQLKPDSPMLEDVELISSSAQRAERLTRQLLAFGRRQPWRPAPLDLPLTIQRLAPMLRRAVGPRIQLELAVPTGLPPVWADESQMEQVVVNFAVNARDAMPDGGVFRLAAERVVLDEAAVSGRVGVSPGAFVRLEARDTGIGMDTATLARVFEPFFTTKPVGKGTGLGLATVYGVVQRAGGFVTVESTPGAGASFRVHLAIANEAALMTPAEEAAIPRARPGETVVVVEDEPAVRVLAARTLRAYGYEVAEAADAMAARQLVRTSRVPISLVLSDVVMPGASGPELAAWLQEDGWPGRVLFMSGYADEELAGRVGLDVGAPFLAKPFTPQELGGAVREAIEARA